MIAKRLMAAKGGRSLPWEADGCQAKLAVAKGGNVCQGMKMVGKGGRGLPTSCWLPMKGYDCQDVDGYQGEEMVANGWRRLPREGNDCQEEHGDLVWQTRSKIANLEKRYVSKAEMRVGMVWRILTLAQIALHLSCKHDVK